MPNGVSFVRNLNKPLWIKIHNFNSQTESLLREMPR